MNRIVSYLLFSKTPAVAERERHFTLHFSLCRQVSHRCGPENGTASYWEGLTLHRIKKLDPAKEKSMLRM